MAEREGLTVVDKFDLDERTARFGEDVIRFARKLPVTPITRRLIDQLVGSATSIGANYGEAHEAESKPAFRVRIATCRKEAKETRHFLRMIAVAVDDARNDARVLWKEADELLRIFATIHRSSAPK